MLKPPAKFIFESTQYSQSKEFCSSQMIIRPASLTDLPSLTEIYNYYVQNSEATFDVQPFIPEQRHGWFRDHSDSPGHRILVAEQNGGEILGYAASGPFRSKEGYRTTVEVTVYCSPGATGKGIGAALYRELFQLLAGEDVHRAVAGIAQPNAASNTLHERLGFTRVGTFTQVGRKFGKYIDVLWMEKVMPKNQPVEIDPGAS